MSKPVERWLATFMCEKYTDILESYGFKTLNSVSNVLTY